MRSAAPSNNIEEKAMETITIVLAMKHTLIRQVLRAYLEDTRAFSVLNEIGDLDKIDEIIFDTRPDVLLIDATMFPSYDSTLLHRLSKLYQGSRIVVISLFCKDDAGMKWLRHGAAGYVSCADNTTSLINALQKVVNRDDWASGVLNEKLEPQQSYLCDSPRSKTLTPREREVLMLVSQGYTSSEIAQRLSISTRTVEGHRARGMQRLELRTTADLIRYALQHGFLTE